MGTGGREVGLLFHLTLGACTAGSPSLSLIGPCHLGITWDPHPGTGRGHYTW